MISVYLRSVFTDTDAKTRFYPQTVNLGNSRPVTILGSEHIPLGFHDGPFLLSIAPAPLVKGLELRYIFGDFPIMINRAGSSMEGDFETEAILVSPYHLNAAFCGNVEAQGYESCCAFMLAPEVKYDVVSFGGQLLFSLWVQEDESPPQSLIEAYQSLQMDFQLSEERTVSADSYNKSTLRKFYRGKPKEAGYHVWFNAETGKIIRIFSAEQNNEARTVAPFIFNTASLETFYMPLIGGRLSFVNFEDHASDPPVQGAIRIINSFLEIDYEY